MNLFNRIVLIVLCLALVAGSIAVVTLTWTIPNRTINWLGEAVEWLDANDGDLERALLTTGAAFVGLVALIVLVIELLPRSGSDVRVTGLSSGNARLSTAAIGQRVEEAVVQVPHVAEVRAEVKAKRKGVLVFLDLQVDPDANLAVVTDEACRAAQEVLSERVHVELLRPPEARLHYRELRLHGRGGAVAVSRRQSRERGAEADSDAVEEGAEGEQRARATAPEPPELPPSLARAQEPPESETWREAERSNGEPEPAEEPAREDEGKPAQT